MRCDRLDETTYAAGLRLLIAATESLSPQSQCQANQLNDQLGGALQTAGHSPGDLQTFETGWLQHLARNHRLGVPEQLMLNRDGATIGAMHGAVLTEMNTPAALEAERTGQPIQPEVASALERSPDPMAPTCGH